jgi:hypothetical protein
MPYDLTLEVGENVTEACPNALGKCFEYSDCPELTPYGECTPPATPDGYEYAGKSSVAYFIIVPCATCTPVTYKCKATGTWRRVQSFYYNLIATESGDGLTFTS